MESQPQILNSGKILKIFTHVLHTKYQGSRPSAFREEDIFNVFTIEVNAKHVTHRAGGHFWPLDNYLKHWLSR